MTEHTGSTAWRGDMHCASPAPVTVRMGANGFSGLARWRELGKLLLRSWWHADATRDWLAGINAQPLLQSLAAVRPRLIVKIYRPYLTNTLTPPERVELLRAHYDFIVRRGLGALTLRAARHGATLAQVTGRSGAGYRIELRAVEPMEREGELVLQLYRAHTLVCSTAFSFFRELRGCFVGVGCLQGPRMAGGLDLIRAATRDLHGLRPKRLLLTLVGVIGHATGCSAVRLVGNENRTVQRARRQGKVHADYDAFWLECGALRRPDGDFEMPCAAPAPLDLALVPSHRRSAVRKRHEIVQALARAVSNELAGALCAGRGQPSTATIVIPLFGPRVAAPAGGLTAARMRQGD
jgi:uncharacterized protein